MKMKGKFWNKSIFWKDITRFWPLWVVEWILLQLAVTLPVYFGVLTCARERSWSKTEMLTNMKETLGRNLFLASFSGAIAIFAIVAAIFVFSYLFKTRAAYAQHSLPVRRESLFAIHYLAGLAVLSVPYIITYLFVLGINVSFGVGMTSQILLCLVETMVMILFFYSLACVVIMLVGNGSMAVTIYVVINFLYMGVMELINGISSEFCYGFYYGEVHYGEGVLEEMLTPVGYFANRAGVTDWYYINDMAEYREGTALINMEAFWQIVAFLFPTVVLIGLALLLYKKRPLESAGNAVAFPWGKWAFRMVFTLCSSLLFSMILYSLANTNIGEGTSYNRNFRVLFVLMIIGSALCYSISNMILEKTFFVWKKMPYSGMVAMVILSMVGMFYLKNTDRWYELPKVEKVEYLSLCINDNDDSMNTYDIDDKELIQKFMTIEKEIIELGRHIEFFSGDCEIIEFCYYGRTDSYDRAYLVPKDKTLLKKLQQLINTPDTICETVFGEDYAEYGSLYIALRESDYDVREIKNSQEMEMLYEAVIRDMKSGNAQIEGVTESVLGYMLVSPMGGEYEEHYAGEKEIPITEKCTNVLDVMNELNLEFQ